MSYHPVVATVVCGLCADEHRRQPSVLGAVEEWPPGQRVWLPYNRRFAKRARRYLGINPRDTAPLVPLWVPDVGDQVEVFCRYHGAGRVSTADVIAVRGRMAVNFTATG